MIGAGRTLVSICLVLVLSLAACSVSPAVVIYNRTAGEIVVHRMPNSVDRQNSIDVLITVKSGRTQTIKDMYIRKRHLTVTVGDCTYFYYMDDRFYQLADYYSFPVPIEFMPDMTLYPLPYQNGEPDRVPRAKLGFPRPPTAKRCVQANK